MRNVGVTVRATVRRPADELRAALENVLEHLERGRGLTLSVDLPTELQTPVEAAIGVPARLTIQAGEGGDLSLRIGAAGRSYRVFPSFWGTLRVEPSNQGDASAVTLRGTYTMPYGAIGETTDRTFLRRAAHSTLRRFLESVIQEAARETSADRRPSHAG